MCGIAGRVLRHGEPKHEDLIAMAQAQHHRGPDNQAVKIAGKAGFAHNRLSILDVSDAANQPFFDSRYILSYNGEIYNYLLLREELERDGIVFRTRSDTEVLFHALIQWGIAQTLQRIQGMFAFSFHDTSEEVTYLCRDHFGIKPLHWINRPEGIYWASEVKALVAVLPIEPDPVITLFSVFSVGEASHHYTVFKDVNHLSPGTYMIIDRTKGLKPQLVEYFHIVNLIDEEYYRELDSLPRDEIISRFRDLFEGAVKKMLISDVPIGAFVSGGIDSSLVAAYARKHNPDLNLFTANVIGNLSEFEDAKLLSRSISAPLHDYPFKSEMFLRDWARATWHYECPIVYFANSIAFLNVAKLAHGKGIKPVLTGEGSDELFLGYPHLIYARFLRLLRMPIAFLKKLYNVVPGLGEKVFPEPGKRPNDFLYNLVNSYDSAKVTDRAAELFEFLPAKDARLQALSAGMMRSHILALLFRNDRMGMLASIEARFPFLDLEVVRFGMNLPHRWKIRRVNRVHNIRSPFHVDKFLVREAAKKVLPGRLTSKEKWGFGIHGHEAIQVEEAFFKRGYVQDVCRLTNSDLAEMLRRENRSFIGMLESVEIFGRLYGLKQPVEDIDRLVHDNTRMML